VKENKCRQVTLKMVPKQYSLRFMCEYEDEQKDCRYFKRRVFMSGCMYNDSMICTCEEAKAEARLAEKLEEL